MLLCECDSRTWSLLSDGTANTWGPLLEQAPLGEGSFQEQGQQEDICCSARGRKEEPGRKASRNKEQGQIASFQPRGLEMLTKTTQVQESPAMEVGPGVRQLMGGWKTRGGH